MPKLGILNVSGNATLRQLPAELSTCDSLVDIIVDIENIVYPPHHIVEMGTREILNYLIVNGNANGNETIDHPIVVNRLSTSNTKAASNHLIHEERGLNSKQARYPKEQVFLGQFLFSINSSQSIGRPYWTKL